MFVALLAADSDVVALAEADVLLAVSVVPEAVVCRPMLVLVVVEIALDLESVIVIVVTVVTEMEVGAGVGEVVVVVGFQPVYCPESYVFVDAHVVCAGVLCCQWLSAGILITDYGW